MEETKMSSRNYLILFGKKLTKEDILEATSAFLDVIMSKEDAEAETTKAIEKINRKNNEKIVEEVLTKLGLSSMHQGTKYIKEIVVYYMSNSDTVNIKKDMYPVLNKKYGVSYDSLRGHMREAIKYAFVRKPTLLARELFGIKDDGKPIKVSSKNFIIKCLDYCRYYAISN